MEVLSPLCGVQLPTIKNQQSILTLPSSKLVEVRLIVKLYLKKFFRDEFDLFLLILFCGLDPMFSTFSYLFILNNPFIGAVKD
jgi:hypothetical protein